MVLCSCDSDFGETCEEEKVCTCSHHGCCESTSSAKKDQCMTLAVCSAWVSKRRAIQKQKRFLGMVRGLAS
nr:conotoxin precursor I4 [Conus ebraeus]